MRKTIRNQSMNCIKSKIIEFGVSDQKFFPNSRLKTQYSQKKNSAQHENNFIVTKRAKIYQKQKQKVKVFSKQKENSGNKISNFQKLKLHAIKLENSQFLRQNSDVLQSKKQHNPNPLSQSFYNQQYVINNQFACSKKVSLMDRYRNNIKKLSSKRKHIKSVNFHQAQFQTSLNFKRINTQQSNFHQKPIQNRRRASVLGVKRYFNKPTTKNQHYKSHSLIQPNLKTKAIQIKKKQKMNKQIVIVCL